MKRSCSPFSRSQVFLLPLGRTNTEYYTVNPVFGSNLNASVAGRKVGHFQVSFVPVVQEYIFTFCILYCRR